VSARRILIVNLTRFGDLLQTAPAVATLRVHHPEAEIAILAERNFADVCDAIPGLDRVIRVDLDRLGGLMLKGGAALLDGYRYVEELLEELRGQTYDMALNFSSSRMTAVFMGLLAIPDVRGWSMTDDGLRVIHHPWARLFASMCLNRRFACFNLVDYYRAMAGGGAGRQQLRYDVTEAARAAVAPLLAHVPAGRRVVAFQLGASREIRQWPAEAFVSLGRTLAHNGYEVALIGGRGDCGLAAAVAREIGDGVTDLCGKTKVAELGALLDRVDALVTGDTGPMHMAVAVGTPVIGLFFGPASPFDTGPYSEDNVLLHATAPCAPCDHNVTCLQPFCRTEIDAETVAAAVVARLANDWTALDRLATVTRTARLYRTGFDGDGRYECSVLGQRPPRPDDEVRRAYRDMWCVLLDKARVPSGVATSVDRAPFAALERLAHEGETLASELRTAVKRRAPIEVIERFGREVEVLDRAIIEQGGMHPDVAVLTQMFKFGKESLEGNDIALLAELTRRLYHDLARGAETMTSLLGGTTYAEREDHAHLHQ
jgi:ADP-heptose:LPS heptosyltransferase